MFGQTAVVDEGIFGVQLHTLVQHPVESSLILRAARAPIGPRTVEVVAGFGRQLAGYDGRNAQGVNAVGLVAERSVDGSVGLVALLLIGSLEGVASGVDVFGAELPPPCLVFRTYGIAVLRKNDRAGVLRAVGVGPFAVASL